MLKRAEPPICVGLYARWGAGKTFMISLLKKEFDPDVREDPRTHQLLQFFEEGYKKLGEQAPANETVSSIIYGFLLNIMLSFVPTVPYGVVTFFSIICDALDPRDTLHEASAGCSRLAHACVYVAQNWYNRRKILAKTAASDLEVSEPLIRKPAVEEPKVEDPPKAVEPKIEFVFVHFNAWECAACT